VNYANDILLAQSQAARTFARSAALSHLQPPEAPPPAGAGATLCWAKAVNVWKNKTGNGSYVESYACADRTGANPVETVIRIYLPRSPGRDPNIVNDQVFAYIVDAAEDNVAVAGYLDDAIGTVKLWSKTGTLPAGWVDCAPGNGASGTVEALAGSSPVGLKSGDSDFGTLGNYGNQGRKTHAHALQKNQPDPPATPVWFENGTYPTIAVNSALTNHLPPWCVVRFIERIDNSALQ
jgi:hypothetical protein